MHLSALVAHSSIYTSTSQHKHSDSPTNPPPRTSSLSLPSHPPRGFRCSQETETRNISLLHSAPTTDSYFAREIRFICDTGANLFIIAVLLLLFPCYWQNNIRSIDIYQRRRQLLHTYYTCTAPHLTQFHPFFSFATHHPRQRYR